MFLEWPVWLNFLTVAVLYVSGMYYLWVYLILDVVVPISLWYNVYFFPQKHLSIQKTF